MGPLDCRPEHLAAGAREHLSLGQSQRHVLVVSSNGNIECSIGLVLGHELCVNLIAIAIVSYRGAGAQPVIQTQLEDVLVIFIVVGLRAEHLNLLGPAGRRSCG